MKGLAAGLAALALLITPRTASADPLSLWVGADPFVGGTGLLDMTRTGVVLHTIDPFGTGTANGIAVDVSHNLLYVSLEGELQKVNLTTLANIGAPIGSGSFLPEDMTFDGTNIWRTDYSLDKVERIDPATNGILGSFTPTGISGPVGIAWDGTGLWVSDFNGTRIEKYTSAGVDTGLGFNITGFRLGGLGFDTTDNTIFLGVDVGVRHYTTGGVLLGSFATPDGRFVDGLEFEGAANTTTVPEPASLMLLGTGLSGILTRKLRKTRRASSSARP